MEGTMKKYIPLKDDPKWRGVVVVPILTDLIQTEAFLKEMNVGTIIHIPKEMYA